MDTMDRMETTEWLSTGEASQVARVSPGWIRKLARSGRLTHIESTLGVLVKRDEVEELARQRAANPTYFARRAQRLATSASAVGAAS